MIARCALLLTLFAWMLAASPAQADLGGYDIRRFDTDLTVQADAGLLVEERIDVFFHEPRHGIYRAIPVRYTDENGFAFSLGLHLEGVTDGEGRRVPTQVSDSGRYVKIRIGHPDRLVQGGVRYVLRYHVRDALGRFPQHDEIYWNATGNEWNTAIESASVNVRLPSALPPDSLQASAYVGRFGEREQSATISFPQPGSVRFVANRPLGSLEGITISVAWPRGHVRYPTAVEKAARLFADNLILLAPLFVAGLLWTQYRRRGRDPQGPASTMVRYEPPQGVSAGEIGTLMDERVDLRDITATIVDLAVRGYLVIRVERREVLLGLTHRDVTIFERTEKPAADLLPHEALVLTGLFQTGNVVEASALRQRFYVHIPGITNALNRRLVETGHFSSDPRSVRRRYALIGFLGAAAVFLLGFLYARSRGMMMPMGLVPSFIAAGVSFAFFLAFAPAMPRRTSSGVRLRSWGRGFEEFVDRVEKEKLERDRAQNVFESLLPYAMALGVAAKWARSFEGIYDTPPSWFQGGMPGAAFSTTSFEHTLASAMQSAGSSMAASPRSSGSGGGGSSGGGGGGGGGGSW